MPCSSGRAIQSPLKKPLINFRGSPPSAKTIMVSSSAVYMMDRPSGVQTGHASAGGSFVNCRSPEPSTFSNQISVGPFAIEIIATRVPSGDSDECATRSPVIDVICCAGRNDRGASPQVSAADDGVVIEKDATVARHVRPHRIDGRVQQSFRPPAIRDRIGAVGAVHTSRSLRLALAIARVSSSEAWQR